jgi:hypothetical protein
VQLLVFMIRTGVPKTSSHFTGWPLAEAVKRTTVSSPDNKSPRFSTMVERGQVVAFGRRRTQSDREWIPADTWNLLINRNFKTSRASGANAKEKAFRDILIYPILHAPNAIDFLDGMLLKDAFSQFVLHDPEVQFLGSKAIKANPDLKQVYLEGRRQPGVGWDWPVAFSQGSLAGGRAQNSPIGYLADPLPHKVQQAADVVCIRYSALLALLRHKKLEAIGDPVRSRGSDRIPSSIWSHRSYSFDANNGDVLQVSASPTNWNDFWMKRWRAVMLKRPMFHGKPPAHDAIRPSTIEQQGLTTPGKAIARVETKMTSFNACWEWLVEIMQASPTKRTETIKSLWEKAQKKWPGTLSERSFLDARTAAIRKTGANAWSAAGAPIKSQRKSPR